MLFADGSGLGDHPDALHTGPTLRCLSVWRRQRGIANQRHVADTLARAVFVVKRHRFGKQVAQVVLAEGHEMVEALVADRQNPASRVGIQVGGLRANRTTPMPWASRMASKESANLPS